MGSIAPSAPTLAPVPRTNRVVRNMNRFDASIALPVMCNVPSSESPVLGRPGHVLRGSSRSVCWTAVVKFSLVFRDPHTTALSSPVRPSVMAATAATSARRVGTPPPSSSPAAFGCSLPSVLAGSPIFDMRTASVPLPVATLMTVRGSPLSPPEPMTLGPWPAIVKAVLMVRCPWCDGCDAAGELLLSSGRLRHTSLTSSSSMTRISCMASQFLRKA